MMQSSYSLFSCEEAHLGGGAGGRNIFQAPYLGDTNDTWLYFSYGFVLLFVPADQYF